MSKVKSKEIENIDMVEENLFPEQIELPFSESVQGNDRFSDNKVLKWYMTNSTRPILR